MHDLIKEKSLIWNTRLKICMDAQEYSQASLAKALNDKYDTSYGQKDVSRWLNTGAKIKNGEVGFPKYETMVLIADFFNVDLGYLIGETEEESFSLEKASSYMGLKGESIQSIRKMTNPESKSIFLWVDIREALDRFFSAKGFANFTTCLSDLNNKYMLPQRESRSFENLDRAIDYMQDIDFQVKVQRYELNEALILLINEIYPDPPKADLDIQEESEI